jgi:hypothetical protein
VAGSDHIEDVLIRVRGESRDAVRAIADVRQELNKVPKSTQAEIEIATAEAQAELDQIKVTLGKIDRTKVTAEVDAEVGKALAKVESFKAALDKATIRKDATVEIDIRRRKVEADISAIQAKLEVLQNQNPEVVVEAKIADAESRLRLLQRQLTKLTRQPQNVDVRLKSERVVTQMEVLRARIAEMMASDPRVTLDAEIGRAMAKLQELEARAAALDDKKREIEVEVDNDAARVLANIEGGLSTLTKGMSRASASSATFGQTMARSFFLIKGITPFLSGITIIITTALLPALVAVGASAASAASGVGILAAAIGGSLIPAAIAGTAVMGRFAAVMEVKQQLDQADEASITASATAEIDYANAVEAARAKLDGLVDSIRNVNRARRNARAVEEQAAQSIQDATDAAIESQQRLAQANAELKQVTVDAYRAMEDAIEDVRDAQLEVENARLGQQEAELNTKEAELRLKEFRQELGLTARALDDTFAKFSDVDADVSGIAGALRRAGKESGKLDAGSLLELEGLLLSVQRAKLGEKQADDQLGDAERTLSRARQEQQKYLEQGIKAYGPYRTAIESVKDAQKVANEAAEHARELDEQGIKDAPAVVAAHQAVADAIRTRNRLQRQLKVPEQPTGPALQQKQAEAQMAELSGDEESFLKRLRLIEDFLRQQFQPTTDAVFDGVKDAMTRAALGVPFLRGKFTQLGETWGDVARQIAGTVISPTSLIDLRGLSDIANEMSKLAGTGLSQFYLLLIRIGKAAGPAALDLMREMVGIIGGLADKAGSLSGKETFFTNAVNSVKTFLRAAGAVGDLFIALVETVAPFGDQIVDLFTDAVKGVTKFLRSARGQKKIKAFFDNTIPAIKEFIKFLGNVIVVFMEIGQFVGPIVGGILKSINFLLDAIGFLLGLLNAIVDNPVGRFLRDLLGQFIGFGVVGKVLKVITFLVGRIFNSLKLLGPAAQKAWGFFSSAIGKVAGALRSVVTRVGAIAGQLIGRFISTIRGATGRLFNAGAWLVRQVMAGIRSIFGPVFNLGASIARRVWNGIKSLARVLLDAGKWLWRKIKEGVQTLLGVGGEIFNKGKEIAEDLGSGLIAAGATLFNIGADLLWELIDGFTTIGRKVWDAIKGLAGKIVDAVKDALGIDSPSKVMYELGQFMLEGLLKGFTSKDVTSFIKDQLGGIAKLGADLAISASPLGPLRRGIGDIQDALGIDIPLLASGGLTRGATLAQIGEGVHREAVIPLSRSVLNSLGRAIARSMPMPMMPRMGTFNVPAIAAAPAGGGGVHVDKIVVESPPGTIPDARVAAVKMARELESRGGGPRQF